MVSKQTYWLSNFSPKDAEAWGAFWLFLFVRIWVLHVVFEGGAHQIVDVFNPELEDLSSCGPFITDIRQLLVVFSPCKGGC